MPNKMRFFAMTAITLFCSVAALAQQTVKGVVVDAETQEPIIGASVVIDGTKQGAVSDVDGRFSVNSKKNNPTLKITYVGYKSATVSAKGNGKAIDLGTLELSPDANVLRDVIVTSQVAIQRQTPVAATTIDEVFIDQKLGTKEFPEVLKSTPSVHANKQGGGYGDSEIYMRGFSTENLAVMVNGVPMNDMENGTVYWSNWAGLSDVTAHMQTQRGLGAAKLSAPSVGGTINIITKSTDAKRGGSVSYGIGNDGMNKMTFSVSSGISKKGWAFTLMGGHQWGDGYIQGTDYEGWNYFVNISKRLGDSHQLSFTAFGAPQWHNQRGTKYGALTIAGWKQVERLYGVKDYKYNPYFGYRANGERYNGDAYNVYHKPQLSLNHTWQIDDKSSLSTVAYMSIGRGYGNATEANSDLGGSYSDLRGASYGTLNTKFRNIDGSFDYAAVEEANAASDGGSIYVMSKSKNYHNWYGLVSTYTTKIGNDIELYGGVDFRYYKGTHTNEITDLLGGDYFIDIASRGSINAADNANATSTAWKYQKLGVGDVIYRDYDSHVWNEGVFMQAEYSHDDLSAFVAGSLSNTSYSRHDRLYYDADHADSGTKNYMGGTIKGGANYNIDRHHNVFINVGYISRAPKFSYGAFMTSTTSNVTNPDARNEKIFSAEVGYGYRSSVLDVKVNGYYTKWMDKTMTKTGSLNNETFYMNMTGVDALHKGVELEVKYTPANWVEFTGMFSYGDWKWDSNAKGYAYDEHGLPMASDGTIASGVGADDHAWASINLKGVKVGGSAQTTAALGANVKLSKDLRLGIDWNYYGRNYAYYDLSGSNLTVGKEISVLDPWEIPAASQFDLNAQYRFNIAGLKATLSGNVDNLFNYFYISKAWNPSSQLGTNPTAATAENIYCFYNFGRTWSVRLKINF